MFLTLLQSCSVWGCQLVGLIHLCILLTVPLEHTIQKRAIHQWLENRNLLPPQGMFSRLHSSLSLAEYYGMHSHMENQLRLITHKFAIISHNWITHYCNNKLKHNGTSYQKLNTKHWPNLTSLFSSFNSTTSLLSCCRKDFEPTYPGENKVS